MPKKLITYKEAIKAILCYLGVIYMIESNTVLVRGSSIWRIDNHLGVLRGIICSNKSFLISFHEDKPSVETRFA
jgi:hypothetical protein